MLTMRLSAPAPPRTAVRELHATAMVFVLLAAIVVALAPGSHDGSIAGPAVVPSGSGSLVVQGTRYAGTFDADGFTYRPSRDGAILRLTTDEVTRGARRVPLDPGTWSGDGSTAERNLARGVEEHVTVDTSGIEWDVVLAARPAGSGDLTVGGRLSGVVGTVVQPGARSLGLRLEDGRVVQLGQLVVKDATGAVLFRVLPSVSGDRIELSVPSGVLDRAVYPLTLDPTFSDGILASDDFDGSRSPSLAFNGNKTLAVWSRGGDVHGVLMTPDATSKASSFRISFNASSEFTPDVAWNGANFLVVWARQVTSPNYDIYGQRVSATGSLVGDEITIASTPNMQMTPAVAAGLDARFMVVWDDNRNTSTSSRDIYGQRVTAAGVPQDGTGLRLSTDISTSRVNEFKPDVAANASRFLAVWEAVTPSYKEIRGSAVGMTGAGSPRLIATNANRDRDVLDPAIASDSATFMVVFEDRRAEGDVGIGISAVKVAADGQPISRHLVNDAPNQQSDPAIGFNESYLVAWVDRRNDANGDIWGAELLTDGSTTWGNFLVTEYYPISSNPTISFAPGRKSHTIAWQDEGGGLEPGIIAFGISTHPK